MEFEELFEYELYEGEVGDGDCTEPHCAITGVKDINLLPADLVLPRKIEDEYYDYYVTEIESGVFKGAQKLKSVVIPGSVKEIGAEVFAECANLKSVTYSTFVEYIYADAFRGCNAIEEVHIDDIGMLCNVSFENANSNPATFAKKVFVGDELLSDRAILPAEVHWHKVDRIRNFAFSGSKIKRIEFSEGVKNMKIDGEAFCGCDELCEIVLPDSLESLHPKGLLSLKNLKFNLYKGSRYLGSENNSYKALVSGAAGEECVLHPSTEIICDGAFGGFCDLKTIYLPSNLKNIMDNAFSDCSNLTHVYLAEDAKIFDTSWLSCCKNIKYAEYCGLKYLGSVSNRYKALVGYLEERESYELHRDVETVCAGAFARNTRLTEIVLPEGVTHVNRNAFSQCVNLERITFPQSIEFVGAEAFLGCKSLKEVHVPSAEVWCNIEFNCSMGEFGNTNPVSHGELYFGESKAEYVEIPTGIIEIKNYAFAGCKTIKRVSLPQSLKSIGLFAFRGCPSLEQVDIPKSVESIGAYAFLACKSLRLVDLPAVKNVPRSAFADCVSLESVSFSAGTETIEPEAFERCSSLKRVELPEGMTAIHQEAFSNCSSMIEAILPESVDIISHSAFEGCSSLKAVTLPAALERLSTCAFQDCSSLESVKIPSVECIERAVFKRCYALKSAVLSHGTKYVGMEVFEDCRSLEHVELPEGLERINSNSFRDCHHLRSLTFPSSLKIIEGGALYSSGIEELKLPDGVELWDEAFMRMGALKRIEIPDTVTKIGRDIFRGCDKNLQIVASDKIKELIARNVRNVW